MSHAVGPDALDDRSVLLVLQEISAQLGEDLAADERTVQTEDEARLLLAELLREYDAKDVDPSEIAASETDAQAMARRTLSLFTEDPSTNPRWRGPWQARTRRRTSSWSSRRPLSPPWY